MKSIDWILAHLNISRTDFFSKKQTRDITQKRWVVIWFYWVAGKNYSEIARKIGKNHTTVIHAINKMDATIKNLAEELLMLYATEVSKTSINFTHTEKPKVLKKVPDYKHSKVVEKEVDFDEVNKPIERISKWDL